MSDKEKKLKGKKKKKVRISTGPKKPSETSVFKKRVAELEKELENVTKNLQLEEVTLERVKAKYIDEVESKKACVEHLKRVLQQTTENTIEIQNRFQWVKDVTELTEQRAADLHRNLMNRQRLKKSNFMQQKEELEEKLSRLEDVSMTRTNQLTKFKRLEEDLEQKTSAERETKRGDNMAHVNNLLKKREDFEHLVDSYSSDANEFFEHSIPVYAKSNLEKNIRLRGESQEEAEKLLAVQDRSRHLKDTQKILDLEMETQESAETRLNDFREHLRDQQGRLINENIRLQSEHIIGREDLESIKSKIRANQREIARYLDKISNVEEILDDQENYINSLAEELKKKTDSNGLKMSKILRAGQILSGKMREAKDEKTGMDSDLLNQIRMILDED